MTKKKGRFLESLNYADISKYDCQSVNALVVESKLIGRLTNLVHFSIVLWSVTY